jgi:predicted PurR-regulated permease PerM
VSTEVQRPHVQIEVPVRTIVRVLVAAICVWAALKLWPQLLLLLVSLLIATTLSPAVSWLEDRNVSRGAAVLLIGFGFFASLAALAWFTLPPLSAQLGALVADLPHLQQRVDGHLPAGHPALKRIVEQVFQLPTAPELNAFLARPLVWGKIAVEAATSFLLVIVLSLYILLDGKRLSAWLLAYVPRKHRLKVAMTVPEVEDVVDAYMLGQLVTSLACALVTFGVLSALQVPAAVPLAVLAGVADVLPVVGIVISTVPAVFLALTVSAPRALAVLGAFLAYHAFETYVLVPRVYGRRLRLSTLAVLIAVIVGGTLQGVLGAILILPLVAAYPVIERIWLHDTLDPDTVSDHRELARAAESEDDEMVDAVLRGHGPAPVPSTSRARRRAASRSARAKEAS